MSIKTIYLFGAGASYGNGASLNDVNKIGIPTVNKFNEDVGRFLGMARTGRHLNHTVWKSEPSSIFIEFESIFNEIGKNYSFDTLAKKYYLRGQPENLMYLKVLLNCYLIYRELSSEVDLRYSLFFATIMQNNGTLPSDLMFLSYNYDAQFERALSEFSEKNDYNNLVNRVTTFGHSTNLNMYLPLFYKMNGGPIFFNTSYPGMNVENSFYKGTLTVNDFGLNFEQIFAPQILKLKEYYKTGFVDSGIRFSWEMPVIFPSPNSYSQNLLNAESFVAIGYSFPTLNKSNDLMLLVYMKNLKNIYIQVKDNYGDVVSRVNSLINSVRSEGFNKDFYPKIIQVDTYEQFFVPD